VTLLDSPSVNLHGFTWETSEVLPSPCFENEGNKLIVFCKSYCWFAYRVLNVWSSREDTFRLWV